MLKLILMIAGKPTPPTPPTYEGSVGQFQLSNSSTFLDSKHHVWPIQAFTGQPSHIHYCEQNIHFNHYCIFNDVSMNETWRIWYNNKKIL